ncbi:uncharacterized protein LOC135844630 [Planococcus citri]|uniref:uncharacterized protein LOC135844630 n=1 Tax=Planococcus citri TaxID=170843 RepID=UPI0031F89F31
MKTSLAVGLLLMAFLIVRTAGVACETSSGQGILSGQQSDGDKSAQDSEAHMKELNKEDEADDESKQDDEEEEEEEEDEATEGPHLTCTLFNNDSACNAMCSIMGTIYGEPVSPGTCVKKDCSCDVPPNATLEDFWKLKFDSSDTLQKIRKNNNLSSKIFDVLKIPHQTPQQTKQNLASLLTPQQLKNLRVKNENSQNLFTKHGAPNPVAVQKYVTKKLKSLKTPLKSKDYKKLLLKSLNDADDDTFNHLWHTIRRSKNKLLIQVLDKYVSDHEIDESEMQSDDEGEISMVGILDTTLINEIIKLVPRKIQPGARGKSSSKSPSSGFKSIQSKEESIAKKQNSSPSSSGITSNDKRTIIDKNLYTLNGFDQTQVARFKQGIKGQKTWDKCWQDSDVYEVCTTRYPSAEFFTWRKLKQITEITMRKSTNGDVRQIWKFDGCGFELERKADGKIIQHWDLPNGSHWEYVKSPDGEVTQQWDGEEDWKSVEYYKSFMDAWCAENAFFYNVGGEPCIMY